MAVVLVVEDNASVAHTVCRHLEERGHTALAAASVAQARLVGTGRPLDAAILDLRLPDGDGLAVFNELRQHWPALVGVMLTAFGSVSNAVVSLQAGMADYVEKPADLMRLVMRIEALVAAVAAPAGPLARAVEGSGPAVRIARVIALALDSPSPPKTLGEWGRLVGVSRSTLRGWCHVIRIHPRDALLLMRGVWALEHASRLDIPPTELLGYLDTRSARAFASRSGLRIQEWQALTPAQFCLEQQLCQSKALVAELIRLLSDRASGPR
jgi:ActR/RegA family two-component response regulator